MGIVLFFYKIIDIFFVLVSQNRIAGRATENPKMVEFSTGCDLNSFSSDFLALQVLPTHGF